MKRCAVVLSGVARCVCGAARDLRLFILGCTVLTTSCARKYSHGGGRSGIQAFSEPMVLQRGYLSDGGRVTASVIASARALPIQL